MRCFKRWLRAELRTFRKAFCRWGEMQEARTYQKAYAELEARLTRLARLRGQHA